MAIINKFALFILSLSKPFRLIIGAVSVHLLINGLAASKKTRGTFFAQERLIIAQIRASPKTNGQLRGFRG